jgi:hypothetical protein
VLLQPEKEFQGSGRIIFLLPEIFRNPVSRPPWNLSFSIPKLNMRCYTMKDGKFSALFLFLFIMIGILLGGVIAEMLKSVLPFMTRSVNVGLTPPATLDLYIMDITFGFAFKFNLGSALGAVGGYVLGKKIG